MPAGAKGRCLVTDSPAPVFTSASSGWQPGPSSPSRAVGHAKSGYTKPRARRRLLPGLFRRSRAAWFCGVGTSTWDRWAAAGLTPPAVKISGAVLWGRAELAEWCRHGCPPRVVWAPIWRAIVASTHNNRIAAKFLRGAH
jgi:predicted DNA-binding transcriptional regulator AlpA